MEMEHWPQVWMQLKKLFYHYTIASSIRLATLVFHRHQWEESLVPHTLVNSTTTAAKVLALQLHVMRNVAVQNPPCVAGAQWYLPQMFCWKRQNSFETPLVICQSLSVSLPQSACLVYCLLTIAVVDYHFAGNLHLHMKTHKSFQS